MESANEATGIEPATPWDSGIQRRDLFTIVAIAVISRVLYIAQYAENLPFLYGPIADSIVYLEQAFRIRHNELGAAVLLAFSPLYGYFLALFGDGARTSPVLAQLGIGCATAIVLYSTTLRLVGRDAARFAAALFLGYGTLLYYESKIMSEALSLLLGALALHTFLGVDVRMGRVRAAVIAGMWFGLTVLARASLVFAAPLMIVAAAAPWQTPREPLSVIARRATGVALGLALVFGGNGLLNYVTSGLFVPVILVSRTVEASAANAYDGNLSSVKFGEGQASAYDVVESAKRRVADLHNGVAQQPSSAMRIDVLAWLRNAPKKLLQTLSPREITFEYGFNGERDHVPVLRLFPVSFGVLLLWGLIGTAMFALERGWRAVIPLSPLVLGVLVTTTLYHPSTRYRLAMILPLLVLSGAGFASLMRRHRAGKVWGLRAAGVVTLGLVALHSQSRGYNRVEFELQCAMSAAAAGDREGQVAHAQEAIRLAPADSSIRQRATTQIQDAQRPR